MILSPTKKAAEQLANSLPVPFLRPHECYTLFHLKTDSPAMVDSTATNAISIINASVEGFDLNPYFLNFETFKHWCYTDVQVDCLKEKPDNDLMQQRLRTHMKEYLSKAFGTHDLCLLGRELGKAVFFVRYRYLEEDVDGKYRYSADSALLHKMITFCREWQETDTKSDQRQGSRETPIGLPLHIIFLIYGEACPLPGPLKSLVKEIDYPPLEAEDFNILLNDSYQGWTYNTNGNSMAEPGELDLRPEDLEWYARHLGSFSQSEVSLMLKEIWPELYQSSPTTEKQFFRSEKTRKWFENRIRAKKNAILQQHDLLKMEDLSDFNEEELQGIDTLRNWLEDHKKAMFLNQNGLSGMLLVGPPGTGKSAAAKLAARIFDLPLVSMDMSKILGRYVGDSEHNMMEMLEDLKIAAPAVFFMDEIDKKFSNVGKNKSGGDGSDVINRLFGMLLTFSQENKKPIFQVATANQITGMPPEFYRNGRYDQAFSVMLPDHKGCVIILQNKLNKYLAPEGKKPYTTDDADEILEHFLGDAKHPRFLAGADIEAYAKEIMWHFGSKSNPSVDDITEYLNVNGAESPVSMMRATASPDMGDTMKYLARCYLDLISLGFMSVGGSSQFKRENLKIDDVRYYTFDPNGDEPTCLKSNEDHNRNHWYDQCFAKELDKAMVDIIMTDEATPKETWLEYVKYRRWKSKTEGGKALRLYEFEEEVAKTPAP